MNQERIEALYSQRNIHTVLHESIKNQLNKLFLNWALIAYMKIPEWIEGTYYESKMKRLKTLKEKIDAEGLDDLIVWIAAAVIHTHSVQTIQQCVGYLANYMPHENPFDKARTAAELLALLSKESGPGAFYHISRNGQGVPATIQVTRWPIIDKQLMGSFNWINDTCFNPPLIEKPVTVKDNRHCGYHTIAEPLILGTLTQHEEKQNYQAINRLNEIEWVLDQEVLKEPEIPSNPLETAEQHQNFTAMVQASRFIYRLLGSNPFWFCWQYDSRGRIYSHGYHVNFQSAEYKKAMLSFNREEYLT
jgi:hypothetical protein